MIKEDDYEKDCFFSYVCCDARDSYGMRRCFRRWDMTRVRSSSETSTTKPNISLKRAVWKRPCCWKTLPDAI